MKEIQAIPIYANNYICLNSQVLLSSNQYFNTKAEKN